MTPCKYDWRGLYSGLNLNQDKATKPQTVQIVRQGEATPYWFKVNPLYQLDMVRGRLKMNVAGLTHHCPNIARICDGNPSALPS